MKDRLLAGGVVIFAIAAIALQTQGAMRAAIAATFAMVVCALARLVWVGDSEPTLRIEDGCRLTKVGQFGEARVIACRSCGLARLTWPGDSVRCFYRDDLDARNVKQALDKMPMGVRREAPAYAERLYRVPDGHCFECGLPQRECRCDGL